MASLASEIKELHELFESGVLTEKEFTEAKTAIIASRKPRLSSFDNLHHAEEGRAVEEEGKLSSVSPQQSNELEWRKKNQNLIFQIRLERAKATIEKTGALYFFVQCFTSDFLGDFLEGTSKSLDVLERILRNLAENPLDEKYQILRLSNEIVRRRVVEQTGGLEFLIQCGAELTKEKTNGLYDKIYLGQVNVENALQVLQQVKEEFYRVKDFREEERQKKAENVLRAAILRNARQLQRNVEQGNPRTGVHAKRTKGEGEEQESNEQRVPLEKALEYLTKSGGKSM